MYKKFSIKKNDIISIVGSGGKTTLMFELGRELKKNGRVLLTTSTKIAVPTDLENDEAFYESLDNIGTERLIVGGGSVKDKKIDSITEQQLKILIPKFDYIIIEADGSKRLPYKASRENEPVIYKMTTKTIAVLPMMKYNEVLEEKEVFNFELLKERFSSLKLNDDLIIEMLNHREGIFKNSIGDKYLYLNRIEDDIENLKVRVENLGINLRR